MELELRAVDPQSNEKLAREAAVEATEAYTAAYHQYLRDVEAYKDAMARAAKGEDVEVVRAPRAPKIKQPGFLGSDYKIYPYPRIDDETGKPVSDGNGMPVLDSIILQSESAANCQDVNITGKDVLYAEPDYGRRGYVNVTLNSAGAERMRRLTGKMKLGSDRLAVVINGVVRCAPTVQSVLGKDFQVSGLNTPGEAGDVARALSPSTGR